MSVSFYALKYQTDNAAHFVKQFYLKLLYLIPSPNFREGEKNYTSWFYIEIDFDV